MEQQYLNLLKEVLEDGEERIDRTGVGTLSLFGKQMRFDLNEGFPAITTKKLLFNKVTSENLFFVKGSSDERELCAIEHGTRDESKKTIWTANAQSEYWKPKAKFDGDLGRVYGVQWRKWRKYVRKNMESIAFGHDVFDVVEIDQLKQIINTIKTNPTDRRMILTAMNIGEFDEMALPPCHMFAQFYVNQKKQQLSCQVYIRSNDLFLGAPFNIAGYAMLTHMIAQVTGLGVGELVMTIGDAHIYLNHIEQVKEQLTRTPFHKPTLWINPEVTDIDDFKMEDFELRNYQHHPSIKGAMAV